MFLSQNVEQILPLFFSRIIIGYCQYTPASYTRNIWSSVPPGPAPMHRSWSLAAPHPRSWGSRDGMTSNPGGRNFGISTQASLAHLTEEQQLALDIDGSSLALLLSWRMSALHLHVLASLILMLSWASWWPGWTNLELGSSFFLKTGLYLAAVVDITTLDPWQTSGVSPEMVFTLAWCILNVMTK